MRVACWVSRTTVCPALALKGQRHAATTCLYMLREVYWNVYVSMSIPRISTIGLLPWKAEHDASPFYIGIEPTRHIYTILGALWPLSGNTLYFILPSGQSDPIERLWCRE